MEGIKPSADELDSLSLACQKLWELDDNRLEPGEDFVLNVQQGKKVFQADDLASEKLFAKVNKAIWQRPTFKIFYYLLDNFESETGHKEVVTAEERKEVSDFLDACINTRPMAYCLNYLKAKGIATGDKAEFKRMLLQMWFSFIRRETESDSCGFEHVFIGESKDDDVSGMHNWVQYWIEECKGHIDYKGFILPKRRDDVQKVDNFDQVMAFQFAWKGELKNVTTMFIGTSPEFELAIYTMCFLAGEEENPIEIGPYNLSIRCYRIRSQYGDKVSSCFPELVSED